MSKIIFQNEMTAALAAAAVYSLELDALRLESRNSAQPTIELRNKMCEVEENLMMEMSKHLDAYLGYQGY